MRGECLGPPRRLYPGWNRAIKFLQSQHNCKQKGPVIPVADDWLEVMVEGVSDGVIAVDAHGGITFVNPAAEAITGLSRQGSSQSLSQLHLLDGGSRQRVDPLQIGIVVDQKRPLLLQAPDGTERSVEPRVVPMMVEGRRAGTVLILRDISNQKRLIDQLKDNERRKDEFLATLAHELRNPLAPIRNALHILKLASHNPPIADQARDMMERQVQQMVRLVDDLLDASRISRGKIQLRKERIELVSVVNTALETTRPILEEAGHELMVSLPSEPILLEVDPTRLAQALANLLNNAAKYTEPGGKIYLVVRRQEGEILITVRDTGIGIPADMLARIFDMFTQVPQSSKRYQGGLGIGLTLVKSLVQLHGGTVEARSEGPGKGTEVTIRLPIVRSIPNVSFTDGLDGNLTPTTNSKLKILIADDNQDSADSLGKVLSILGYQVQTVSDGPAALMTFRQFQPDLAILDIGMPGLSGLEVAQRVRQHPDGKDVVLVALTGWGQDEIRRSSREAGFDFHLVKPVEPDELTRLLAQIKTRR